MAVAAVAFWLGRLYERERMANQAEIVHLRGVIDELRQRMNESGYLEYVAWQAKRAAKRAKK